LALKTEWRLKAKKDFEELAQAGRRETTPLLKIWWTPGQGLAAVRVSKKISKKAVIRNRLRRWLSEELRLGREHWQDKKMVVIVREPISREMKNRLLIECRQILSRWAGAKK
jgi:ribonuclease P protein component